MPKDLPALRLTRDEWMLQLHGPRRHDDPEYVAAIPKCTELMWEVAAQALCLGISVILDWNHWNAPRRAESRERAQALGAPLVVHFVDASVDVAVSQARARFATDDTGCHRMEEHDVRHFATIFEPPHPREADEVIRHSRPSEGDS